MSRILIVDDNKSMLYTLSKILEDAGYSCLTAENGQSAIQKVKSSDFALVILDFKMPDSDGLKVLVSLKSLKPELPVIILTAFGEIKKAVEAIKSGAEDYITKPFDNNEMLKSIKRVLGSDTSSQLRNSGDKLTEKSVDNFIVLSGNGMSEVLRQVKLVAPTNLTVLLQGESGTGKEVIANIIHKLSERSSGPFVGVDCGAIPETLFESELFGYEKGAFTDAKSAKEGKFESAEKGTLFLDEILNLSDSNQVKLLRVLEEKKITRLGGNLQREFDVRILTASNFNLSEAVKEKKFRADLFYRLNEFQILIPPLRERRESIPDFVRQFIKDANTELNRTVTSISGEALSEFASYTWPGNVRELRNAVRRAVLLCEGERIETVGFSLGYGIPLLNTNSETGNSFGASARNAEREIIIQALEQNNGNKTKTAKMLKMNIRTLYRKIKALNISAEA